jgi:hypothetical protein
MRVLLFVTMAALGCSGKTSPPPAPEKPIGMGPRRCESYAEVEAAPAPRAELLERWRSLARSGEVNALAAAIDTPRAQKVAIALGHDPTRLEAELASLLAAVPATCAARWVPQDGRLAIQPPLDDTPPEKQRAIDEGIDALGSAEQFVLTCDDCGELAIAVANDRAVAWGVIP